MSATTLHTVGRDTARIVGSVVVGMAIMAGLGWAVLGSLLREWGEPA